MAETLEKRFRRLLLMVPYVVQRGSVEVNELCRQFQITRKQLAADIEFLYLCGKPGYGPEDLIEADFDGSYVMIKTADYFAKPLRLTSAEGLVLYSGTKALAAAGVGGEALERAVARLAEALEPDVLSRVHVDIDEAKDLAKVREALNLKQRIHVTYKSRGTEELTERDVDPWTLFVSNGSWYLAGWCHRATDERVFRMDRMQSVEILDESADIPAEIDPSSFDAMYVEGPNSTKIIVDISKDAAYWVTKYYPPESQETLDDGWVRIQLSAGGTAWLERLLLRLGNEARIIEPKKLAESVKRTACELAARYSTAG